MRRLSLAAALLLAAPLAAPAARAKDTLALGMVLEPPHLDVTAGAAAAIREVTYANLYEGLTRIDARGEVRPGLAESWTVSPDGRSYAFKLRTGVVFHDSSPFDCSVVKFSYDRAAAADSVNAQKPLFAAIARTECPDPATAVVTLTQPTASFLFNMGWGDAAMISPKSAATNKTSPVGTGPFRFKSWSKGDRVELVRNDAYWGARPKLAAVTFRFIADPTAAAAAMLAGDIDAFPLFPAPETLDRFRADKRFKVAVGSTAGKIVMSLNEARKPFDDVRVRRALAYAIDRRLYIEGVLSGFGEPIGSHYMPGDVAYVDLTGAYPYDPAKAKALLAEAGIKPGFTMTITMPPPGYARKGGEVIAALLEQVGITAKLAPMEWAQWLDIVFKQYNYDATLIAHVEPRDLGIYARDSYYFNYRNPEYRALYDRYLAATDPAAQASLLGDLQRKLSADKPNVFLATLPKIGVWDAKVLGLWENAPVPANDVTGVSWAE